MLFLFTKIFVSGLLITVLFLCFKKFFSLTIPLWTHKKSLNQLHHLTNSNMYDKQTINQALKSYIPPKFQEIHPNKRATKGKYRIRRKDLTTAVDLFLDHKVPCRHLLLLADSGMGKTCFALNFYIHNKNRPKKNRHKIVLIPLRLPNADQLILSLPDQNDCVLFLDALDKDIKAFQKPHERIRQIIDQTSKFKRVIITSNLNFIPAIRHLPTQKGYEIIEPKNINDNRIYRLRRFYMSPMTLSDVKKNLNAKIPFWQKNLRKKIEELIRENPSLDITHLMLNYLIEIIQEDPNILSKNDVYKAMLKKRMNHELHWEDKTLFNQFLQKLATDLYLRWIQTGEESISIDTLGQKARTWGITLHDFTNDMQSVLNQGSSGLLRFTHRSIMEYLFVQQLISGDKSCYQVPLTDLMKKFLFEILCVDQSVNLKLEFNWLTLFELKAQGLTRKTTLDNTTEQTNIFQTILKKNNQYEFLNRLNTLFQNPIFYEFGWDPTLNKNLDQAIFQSKSSVMKLDKKKWTVLINLQTIEITKQDQKNVQILINKNECREYSNIQDDISLITLNNAIGLKGLEMLNNINQSKSIAALPDLKTFNTFTICFEETFLRE
ncbi:MAG: hypothetical protein ABIJ59_12410 [Pseudomonadota bacterium]